MNVMKRAAIWLAAMLAVIFIVNAAGSIIVKKAAADTLLGASLGYSRKADAMIHPSTNKEQNYVSARLVMRTVLSDDHFINEPGFFYNFLFSNIALDETNLFFDKDGLNELSSGIFACVYQRNGESLDYIKNTFGVINVKDFCELDCAAEIYNTLESEPEAVIKLNSYTISNYIVEPVSITLLDVNGNELLHVECPYEGELVEGSDCFIRNECENKAYDCNSLYQKMNNAFLGERKTDRIAKKLVNEVNFDNGDYSTDKTIYGFGNMTVTHIELTDGCSQITVLRFQFIKGVVFYTVILGAVMSIIMFIIIKKKSY